MKAVVVGAGVAGLGIGWRLAQAGVSVTVLERSQPGSGASFAAAGMIALVAELAEAGDAEIVFARYSRSLWPGFAMELEAASVSIGLSRERRPDADSGSACRPAARHGVAGCRRCPGPRAHVDRRHDAVGGALGAAGGAGRQPRPGSGFGGAFVRAGGAACSNTAVTAIEERDGQAVAARTPFGFHAADIFILAAGAWSGLIETVPITPVKGQMIALAPPPGGDIPDPVIWGNGVYLVPRLNEGRLLIGATVEEAGFDTSLTRAARDDLRARAEAILPGLKDWRLAEHWAGLRPRSPDGLPLLGPTATWNIFVAGGQYRNGILFAPAIAAHLARPGAGPRRRHSRIRSPKIFQSVTWLILRWTPSFFR